MFTLYDLQCFDAVVREGGFQAAAKSLHRTHPAVFAAVARLERQLDLKLLDRSAYRVRLTDLGTGFYRQAQSLLREMQSLQMLAAQLSAGKEADLHIVIGDLCPRPQVLAMLSRFFAGQRDTRLHLHFEAVSGPAERLLDGDADLILHGIDKTDPRLEWIDVCEVPFIPVVAPGFLPVPVTKAIRPEQMKNFTQCVIRDTARHTGPRGHYIVEGAQQCTVADQSMKKELIVQGLGWGHLPAFLIEDELRSGQLISIAGRHLPGSVERFGAARRLDRPRGPVAQELWEHIEQQAPLLRKTIPGTTRRRS